MSAAISVPRQNGQSAALASSPTKSTVTASPKTPTSLHDRFKLQMSSSIRQPSVLHPIENENLRILVLENISLEAVKAFTSQGFQVDHHKKAMSEEELLKVIGSYHAIGIRSKTKITERVIKAASKLLVIGCFCIGTNQVDLATAAKAGIPVFNSPFSNSRSVAELVMSEVIALSRQLFERAHEMRAGIWNKQSKGCWEVRGKTLGIVGYGHIGAQLSVLAESFGLRVLFFDVLNIMPLGSARQMDSLEALLSNSDFVSLHVPEIPETINMISHEQLAAMKQGSYLINNARGRVVDIPALIDALQSQHLAGAAIDVYPAEPGANGDPFDDNLNKWATALRALPNVILTPHIGGSTEEAQSMIGEEVSTALSRYLNAGTTLSAVNFPEVDLRAISPDQVDNVRVCHVHKNQPGVLKQVNDVLSPYNVEKQFSDSKGEIAYLMADIANISSRDVNRLKEMIEQTSSNVLTRLLVG
jgi:D-3-phosphoglycerate dehydrogenase